MIGTKPKILVIVGPTASGKTGLSIEIAKKVNGEIISADSRQVYRGLDIGSGKVTKAEMAGVPHHLLGVVEATTVYSAADFKRDASAAINEITARKHLPIIAGGTFFYVDTLLGTTTSPDVPADPLLRAELEARPTTELFDLLKEKDPARATTIDPHNKRRLVRALEIVQALGAVPPVSPTEPYDVLTLGIAADKEQLRIRFQERVEEWLQAGLMDEIARLLDSGLGKDRLAEIGFEYLLGIELYEQKITTEEYLQKFVEKNWQYAKRQMTWLKRDPDIVWVDPKDTERVIGLVRDWQQN